MKPLTRCRGRKSPFKRSFLSAHPRLGLGQERNRLTETLVSTDGAEKDATIKALQWKLLYGNHRAELEGEDGWPALAEETGAPADVKVLPLSKDVPLAPFNQALVYLDDALGTGDGAKVRERGVASVQRWATMYRRLVAEFQGRPGPMLELFCTEVHPWFVNDASGARLIEQGRGRAVIALPGELPTPFRKGLLEGFVGITGTQGSVEALDGDRFLVTWPAEDEALSPLAQTVLRVTRSWTLPGTLIPVLLGTAMAWLHGAFDPVLATGATVAALLLHVSAYAFNDVADHLRGVDTANLTPTPFGGGSRTLQLGMLGWKALIGLSAGLGLAGIGLGLALVAASTPWVLALGLVGIGLGVAYSAPPFRLADRGLGELTVAIVFGPLITLGAYAVQAGELAWAPALAGFVPGLLAGCATFIGEMPDAPWDARTGRRTLVVRAGDHAPTLFTTLTILPHLALAGLVLTGILPAWTLVALATFPLSAVIALGTRNTWRSPDALVPYQALTLTLQAGTGLLLVAALLLEVLSP